MLPRRRERLSELLKQRISELIPRLKDPSLGFVTITGVDLLDDLSRLRVFYSVLGTDEDRRNTHAALTRARGEINRSLNELENLRRIPKLEFVYDDTPAKADRIERLLMRIDTERHEPQNEKPREP